MRIPTALFGQDVASTPAAPTVPNLPDVNLQLLLLVIQDHRFLKTAE